MFARIERFETCSLVLKNRLKLFITYMRVPQPIFIPSKSQLSKETAGTSTKAKNMLIHTYVKLYLLKVVENISCISFIEEDDRQGYTAYSCCKNNLIPFERHKIYFDLGIWKCSLCSSKNKLDFTFNVFKRSIKVLRFLCQFLLLTHSNKKPF